MNIAAKKWSKSSGVLPTSNNAYFHEPARQLYKLHKKLDDLVMQAYGFTPEDDILEKFLALTQELVAGFRLTRNKINRIRGAEHSAIPS